ncbi:phage holin family protein [Vagococcus hydrophili]|uniref:Phage holin family protein n=1 Tax=Vagococcus hydrophili TaxID=2714947 RepID=A0A6G8AQ73_9ENTE|nr:phage holin family protein [Vagococcus hydrophili]QIL47137.1 phage holin family protein [Vagococcus hydrophili]
MSYLQRLIVNTLAFISLSVLFPYKFYVGSLLMAFLASVVLSGLNMFVKPILHILSLPITLITFGLFSFIINAMMLKFTSVLVGEQNFAFSSFGSAILIAVIMSIINSIVSDHFSSKYN